MLKIKPIEDLELQIDYLYRGQLAHDVLAALHRRVNETAGPARLAAGTEQAECERLLQRPLPRRSCRVRAARPRPRSARSICAGAAGGWPTIAGSMKSTEDCGRSCDAARAGVVRGRFRRQPQQGRRPRSRIRWSSTSDDQTVRLSGRIDRIDTARGRRHALLTCSTTRRAAGR